MNSFYCKICFTPASKPNSFFNNLGECNACVRKKKLSKAMNWNKKKKEFESIIKIIKSKKNKYDCVVPFSGGKDSSSIALKLKFEYGLNPLLVTFAPIMPTEIGIHNRLEIINKGFTNIVINPNGKIVKKLSKKFFIDRGNPKVHWHAGIAAGPINVAIEKKIPYIFYAENPEEEYAEIGGRKDRRKKNKLTETALIESWVGDYPENWQDNEISKEDLDPYIIRSSNFEKIHPLYFGHYFPWDVYLNFKYVNEKINFKTTSRTIGTFTNYDSLDDEMDDLYYYMQYIKFGYGRCIRDAARHVTKKKINKKQAISLIKKYDGEFPKERFKKYADYFEMNILDFHKIINLHRNDEIWKKKGNKFDLINKLT